MGSKCEKDSFEISHNILNPYMANIHFNYFHICVWFTISLNHDVVASTRRSPYRWHGGHPIMKGIHGNDGKRYTTWYQLDKKCPEQGTRAHECKGNTTEITSWQKTLTLVVHWYHHLFLKRKNRHQAHPKSPAEPVVVILRRINTSAAETAEQSL